MQFEYHLTFHQKQTKLYENSNGLHLMNLNEISNDTQIL
jgi:hypothetical protein